MIAIGPLKTRATPTQARAVERVHLILHTTADLLRSEAPAQLSTTTIATRAGIPVSSIYRYFPTLDALLQELYLQVSGELRTKLFNAISDDTLRPGWRERLATALTTLHDYLETHTYYSPLLMYFLVRREPLAMQADEHEEIFAFLSHRWAAGQDGFSGGDPVVVARTVTQIAISLEDLVAAQPSRAAAEAQFTELRRVLESYLARYLNDPD